MATPVVTVAAGGIPVVDVTAVAPLRGLPVSEATNGRGIAVTKVNMVAATGKPPGMPVVYAAASLLLSGPPAVLSAQVTSVSPAPTKITMTFDKPLDPASVPPASAFLAVRNFIGKVPVSVTILGSTCSATLDADYGDPTGGTISYTPGSPLLKGTNGVAVAAFSNIPVNP